MSTCLKINFKQLTKNNKENKMNNKITLKTNVDFNDVILANYAYEQCEKFIRSCEAQNENNAKYNLNSTNGDTSLYNKCVADFDYYIVGKVFSFKTKSSFENYVENDATNKADLNERAYKWLMMNAVYENYSMYILEVFKHQYITKDRNADVWKGFENWVRSTKNDDGTFTFFSDTQQPLTIR